MALTASLICRLFAATSTINTKVLLSSIFFIALSVVKGYLMTRYLSIFARAGAAFNAYLGAFGGWKLLGRSHWTFVRRLPSFLPVPARPAAAVLSAIFGLLRTPSALPLGNLMIARTPPQL